MIIAEKQSVNSFAKWLNEEIIRHSWQAKRDQDPWISSGVPPCIWERDTSWCHPDCKRVQQIPAGKHWKVIWHGLGFPF